MMILQNISGRQSRKCTHADVRKIVAPAVIPMADLCRQPTGKHVYGAYALAHCQVEQEDPLRFFVRADGLCYINPVITEKLGDPVTCYEGCMSWAHRGEKKVKRYPAIVVSATILRLSTLQATHHDGLKFEGIMAQVFQHEIDHMNGAHLFP